MSNSPTQPMADGVWIDLVEEGPSGGSVAQPPSQARLPSEAESQLLQRLSADEIPATHAEARAALEATSGHVGKALNQLKRVREAGSSTSPASGAHATALETPGLEC